MGGADENIFLTYPVDPRRLREGTNVIAVEIHQAGLTSSDLSFDLELAGLPQPVPFTLIPADAVWKFRDNNITPSAPWTTAAYNDAAWNSGPARLGYGGDGEATLISNGGDAANVFTTTWFRRTFMVPDASAFDGLRVDLQRDDGALVYLNGTELLRDNLSSAGITSATFAATAIGGADEQAWRSFVVPASALVTGTNVLAVEIHQGSATSSDMVCDAAITLTIAPPGGTAFGVMEINDTPFIIWDDPLMILETSPDLTGWVPQIGVPSPAPMSTTGRRLLYRARK